MPDITCTLADFSSSAHLKIYRAAGTPPTSAISNDLLNHVCRNMGRTKSLAQIGLEGLFHFRVPQRELDCRFEITEFAAAIEALASVAISQHLFMNQ